MRCEGKGIGQWERSGDNSRGIERKLYGTVGVRDFGRRVVFRRESYNRHIQDEADLQGYKIKIVSHVAEYCEKKIVHGLLLSAYVALFLQAL